MTSNPEQEQETTEGTEPPTAPAAAVDEFFKLIVPEAGVPEEEQQAGTAPRTTGD